MKKTGYQLIILSLLIALIWGLGATNNEEASEAAIRLEDQVSQELAAVKKTRGEGVPLQKNGPKDAFDNLAANLDEDEVANEEDFNDPEALRKHGVDRLMMMAFHNKGELFLRAIESVDSNQREKLLNELKDKEGHGLLHWSVMGGCESCFLTLIAKGINVNQANSRGETPLVFAAASGEEMMVKRLLQAGADPNVEFNKAGYTLLMDASFEGLTTVAADLIRAQAKIDAQDNRGQTALHYAAKEGHRELIELLIKQGARSDIADKNKMRPIDYALKYHDSSLSELFKP